jgi:hypothetical protein
VIPKNGFHPIGILRDIWDFKPFCRKVEGLFHLSGLHPFFLAFILCGAKIEIYHIIL